MYKLVRFQETSAIPISLYRKYLREIKQDSKTYEPYNKIFDKYKGDAKAQRIYLPLKGDVKLDVAIPTSIYNYLRDKGYKIDDYVLGIASTDNGKRKVRIGKLLSDDAELKKKFDNDPQRAASKKNELLVVISRHPYDILGMSTDRGWYSCMEMTNGINNHYLAPDVEAKTLVAYLVRPDDKNINKPIARKRILKYTNLEKTDDFILVPHEKTYGTASPAFDTVVQKWCEENSVSSTNGLYCVKDNIYDDGMPTTRLAYSSISTKLLDFLEKEDRHGTFSMNSLEKYYDAVIDLPVDDSLTLEEEWKEYKTSSVLLLLAVKFPVSDAQLYSTIDNMFEALTDIYSYPDAELLSKLLKQIEHTQRKTLEDLLANCPSMRKSLLVVSLLVYMLYKNQIARFQAGVLLSKLDLFSLNPKEVKTQITGYLKDTEAFLLLNTALDQTTNENTFKILLKVAALLKGKLPNYIASHYKKLLAYEPLDWPISFETALEIQNQNLSERQFANLIDSLDVTHVLPYIAAKVDLTLAPDNRLAILIKNPEHIEFHRALFNPTFLESFSEEHKQALAIAEKEQYFYSNAKSAVRDEPNMHPELKEYLTQLLSKYNQESAVQELAYYLSQGVK